MDVKSSLDEHRKDSKIKSMAPSSSIATPLRNLGRPRSLSLNVCCPIGGEGKKYEEKPVMILENENLLNRYRHLSEIGTGPDLSFQTGGIIQSGSSPIRTRSQQRKGEKKKTETSLAFAPAPTSVIATIEKPYSSKLTLQKTPSTPVPTRKLPSSSGNSKFPVSAPVSSPTNSNRSRLTLPTSPGIITAQKKVALDDPNPFGADLVRYQNGANVTSANRSGNVSSKGIMDSTTMINCRTEEDTPFLQRDKESNHTRILENNLADSKRDVEKATSLDAWSGNGPSTGTGFLRNRFSTRRIRNRLMQKDGECNISLHNVPKQTSKYFSDIFTTLVEVKWRWCLLIFALGFLLSWLLFGVIYYLIMLSHGDFRHLDDPDWRFCVVNIRNFVSVFMFSLESQHTIGYGTRHPSEECPAVVATVCLQSMVGVMIQTFMAGIVFAKLARAKKRAETLIFSKNGVICMRDGKLCFLFRVGDMRKSQLAEAHIRLQMISKRITNEGELLPFHQFDMNVGYDSGLDRIFVVWPITICHVIDENSPLYEYSADDLATARFEIIAILEGVVPSIGTTTQARTSYLPQEIIWGSRFEKLVTYQRENGEYRIDFSKFHKIYPQETPTCSARDLDLLREVGLNLEEVYHVEGDEQAENQGLTPYSTVDSRMEPKRPSILPPKEESMVESENGENNDQTALMEGDDETGHLLPHPPSTAALITMTPAERKASIAAAAAAFRKNKSLSETARKASLAAYSKIRKPSVNVTKVGVADDVSGGTSVGRTPEPATPTNGTRILRHASSTGCVPVQAFSIAPSGCNMKPRPSSVLREHDIM